MFLYVKLVDIVEKDIFMLSRDHLFPKKKGEAVDGCPVLEMSEVHLGVLWG